ncbi:MAG: hypothetical protein ABWK01_03415 [Infirmifilum sp.]
MSLERALREALDEFNRYHGVEAKARVIRVEGETFTVEFTGSFCVTCGFYDYFEDFAILLSHRGFNVGIVRVEESEEGAVVQYKLLAPGVKWRFVPEKQVLILK